MRKRQNGSSPTCRSDRLPDYFDFTVPSCRPCELVLRLADVDEELTALHKPRTVDENGFQLPARILRLSYPGRCSLVFSNFPTIFDGFFFLWTTFILRWLYDRERFGFVLVPWRICIRFCQDFCLFSAEFLMQV